MANMNLVTGYIGENHVTANDAGSFNAAIFGTGQYLLNRGQKFAATVVTNNQLRIADGDLIMQGRHVRIDEGDYVDLTIENGATNYNRNDLIVARYTKDASSGVEAVNLVVINGTAVIGTAEDPKYTVGDIINGGATLNDMPLYRVQIVGLAVTSVTPLAEEVPNVHDVLSQSKNLLIPVNRGGTGATNAATARSNLGITISNLGAAPASHNHSADNITSGTLTVARGGTGATTAAAARSALGITPANIGAVTKATTSVSLSAYSWSASAPYTQTVSASGVTASNTVIVAPAYASQAHYNDCGVGASAQAAGNLTFTAQSKPSATLTVNVLILN